ncbi:MAG: MltA domain-containing protein [Syntrophaceae bacterium]|nr:MltA domain-containing protein [Syntrophaceae bacterium]
MKYSLKIFILIIIISSLGGCMRAIPKTAIVKSLETFILIDAEEIDFADDLDYESLELAIDRSIDYYEKAGRNKFYKIEDRVIGAKKLKDTLTAFRDILRETGNRADLSEIIVEEFDVYSTTGFDDEGGVLFTGYYEPLLAGARERTEKYRYPLYRVPPDLVIEENQVSRIEDGKFVPYYSRREIDVDGVLRGKNLELLWVSDPVELFSLHIQGSGKIKLEDGAVLTVGFAQTNGRSFSSITKFMLEEGRIRNDEASYRYDFLRGKSDQEIYDILSHNERYTFFRFLEKEPVGSLGEPVTPDRSIATDPEFFPEGALAFINLRKPVFDEEGNIKERKNFSRFVLSQDKGAAIKGPGRVDIFCGFGDKAELTAGTLKEEGELFLLLKK